MFVCAHTKGVNRKWLRLSVQECEHTLVPLFIYTTKNTAVTSHWHRHFKHCFLVQSIPCKAGWHFLISRAYSGNGAESVSDSHRSPLLCNSSYLCCQTLQIPSEQVYDLWSLWATTEIYSSVNITLSWSPSCHLTLLAKNTTELKKKKTVFLPRKTSDRPWITVLSVQYGVEKSDFGNVI